MDPHPKLHSFPFVLVADEVDAVDVVMLGRGDLDGAAVWRRIVAAVNEIQREEPKPGERRH